MARHVTIDRSGRLVIPKEVRTSHHLEPGTRLALLEDDDRLVLVPETSEAKLVEKNGLLVVSGPAAGAEIPDHRDLRKERLDHLSSGR